MFNLSMLQTINYILEKCWKTQTSYRMLYDLLNKQVVNAAQLFPLF